MVGLGGLEPPTSPLSVVNERPATECDGFLSCWFSAPVRAICLLLDYHRLLPFLMEGGHKIGHSRVEGPELSSQKEGHYEDVPESSRIP